MKQNLVDHAEFLVKAGNGGNGSVHFRREKYVPKGGPDGGDGGKGGSIYLEVDPNLRTLQRFAGKDRFSAPRGGHGSGRKQHGKDAKDLTLKVPVGTVVFAKTEENEWQHVVDLDTAGERYQIAKGGEGGRGNTAFASSTNTTPRTAEEGERGERKQLKLELKLLADIGLVGLPNAGKSTLLSVLTSARPEIANYPFTTLSPNLGVLKQGSQSMVLADIPGLIERAHEGKGLGTAFLKHIERCRILAVVVAPMDEMLVEETDLAEALWQQFEVVRGELQQYSQTLYEKPYLTLINKRDVLSPEQLELIQQRFSKEEIMTMAVSAATLEGIETLKEALAENFTEVMAEEA